MNFEIPVQALAAGSTLAKAESSPAARARRKIWIDLDNSPHVPFFCPNHRRTAETQLFDPGYGARLFSSA